MPSRRHCLHFGSRSRAISGHLPSRSGDALRGPGGCEVGGKRPPSNTPPLLRADAVVRLWGHVLDAEDLDPGRLKRADRGLAPRAGPLDEHLDLLEAVLHALAGAGVGGHLRGEGRRLAGALEARGAGALPADDVPLLVGQGDDRVVEGRLDVRLADRDVLLDATAGARLRALLTAGRRHLLLPLAAADGLLRALSPPRVRLPPLPVHREPAAVPDAAVAADLHQALACLREGAVEGALDLEG